MSVALRFINDNRGLWRIWLPLIIVSIVTPMLAMMVPLLQRRLIDDVILPQQMDLLPKTAGLYAAAWILSSVVLVSGGILRSYFAERLTLESRQRLFAHSEVLSVSFSRQEHSGRTMSLFVNDVPSVTGLFSNTILTGVSSLFALVIGAIIMFRLNPSLALVAAAAPIVVATGAALVTRPLRPAARRAQEKAAELNEHLQENLSGMREVVAFGREHLQSARFRTTLQDLLRLRFRVTLIESTIGFGASLFSLIMSLTIFIYGAYLVIESQTTLGTVLAMQTLFGLLFQPAGNMMGLFTSSQKALGAADRVYAFLDEVPAVEDEGDIELQDVKGNIEFQKVSFSYRDGEPVLTDVTFAAREGDVVALVGPSGAGKTTISSLLARFYDPDEGRILLDGIDLRDIPLRDLRNQIGFVFQDTFLFADTIRANIAFGREDATEDEIIEAARVAYALEFIERLPDGLDAQVGERGFQLSEGQKQRIAIARALLRDPRILILDEPTSALDARSEDMLQAAFENLMQGRTTFVIAHRLATVHRADRILVVNDGRIVEHGTHWELMKAGGLYRELFDLQFGRTHLFEPEPSTTATSQLVATGDDD